MSVDVLFRKVILSNALFAVRFLRYGKMKIKTHEEEVLALKRNIVVWQKVLAQASNYKTFNQEIFRAALMIEEQKLRELEDPWGDVGKRR
jgi:hypothetical protein